MFSLKIKVLLSLCCIIVFSENLFSQNGLYDQTIAEIDGEKITASLFQEMWEMSPHLNTNNKGNSLSEKINFLNTMVAYKLWHRNMGKYSVDTSSAYSTAVNEIEKMFVRDALYKREILNKIIITKEELDSALKKQERTLVVKYLLSSQEEEIKNLYKLLNSGIPFNSLLSERPEFQKRTEPIKIKFGDYPDPTESELFSLKQNTYSQPIKFSDGYYIFYLDNSIKKIWGGEEDQKKEIQKTEDIIKKRKENVLYDDFMKKTLNGVKANVNKELFKKLESGLVNAYKGKKTGGGNKTFITLSIEEYIELKNTFTKDELEHDFISFKDAAVNLRKSLRALYFNGLKMPSSDAASVAKTFDTYVRNYIKMEVLYKDGIQLGLQNSPEVLKYRQMWSEFYSFETIRGGMIDTVKISPDKIRSVYNDIYKDMTENTFMKFDYACFRDSTIANSVVQKIMSGLTFEGMRNKSSSKIENEFYSEKNNWVPVSDCGNFKTQLIEKEPGSYLGPIKHDSLYVLIKVVDKKKSKELLGYSSYEEAYPKLKNQLAWEKIKGQITKKTADFAVGANVKINYEALKKIELTRISSITIRFLGFGGSISGVPVYTPNYEWTELLDSKTLLP
jgi:hypothetical protein